MPAHERRTLPAGSPRAAVYGRAVQHSWSRARARNVVGVVTLVLAAAFVVCVVQRYGHHSRHMSPAGSTPATPLERAAGWSALLGAAVWSAAAVDSLRHHPSPARPLSTSARSAVVAASSAVLTVVAVVQRLLVHRDSTGTLDAVDNLTPFDTTLVAVSLTACVVAAIVFLVGLVRTRSRAGSRAGGAVRVS